MKKLPSEELRPYKYQLYSLIGKRCHFIHDEPLEELQRLRLLNSAPALKGCGKKQSARAFAVATSARARVPAAPAAARPAVQPLLQQQCRPPPAACALLALAHMAFANANSIALADC